MLGIPYGTWQIWFADKISENGHDGRVLYFASSIGDTDVARTFISRGTSVEYCSSEGRTVLHSAAAGGSLKIVRLALENGSEINALSDWGDSPAQVAKNRGHQDIVRYLLSGGGKLITGCPRHRQSGPDDADPEREICIQYRCSQ
jgi:ankyrin repeat protein